MQGTKYTEPDLGVKHLLVVAQSPKAFVKCDVTFAEASFIATSGEATRHQQGRERKGRKRWKLRKKHFETL